MLEEDDFSAGGDFDFEATTGERPKKGMAEQLMGSYLKALMKMSIDDTSVYNPVQQVSVSTLCRVLAFDMQT